MNVPITNFTAVYCSNVFGGGWRLEGYFATNSFSVPTNTLATFLALYDNQGTSTSILIYTPSTGTNAIKGSAPLPYAYAQNTLPIPGPATVVLESNTAQPNNVAFAVVRFERARIVHPGVRVP